MAGDSQSKWMPIFDIVLKVMTGVLVPLTILIAGQLVALQQQKNNQATLAQQRQVDLEQRNADRVTNLYKSLASDNPTERILAVRIIEYLAQANQFPAELGPALITVSLSDKDPEVARAAAEVLPQAYKSNPELEKKVVVETQRILKANGYYNGEVDGLNSESTREALRRFQQEHSINADGSVKPETIQKLRDFRQRAQGGSPDVQKPNATETPQGRRPLLPRLRG